MDFAPPGGGHVPPLSVGNVPRIPPNRLQIKVIRLAPEYACPRWPTPKKNLHFFFI
jgi:hypothetical protein